LRGLTINRSMLRTFVLPGSAMLPAPSSLITYPDAYVAIRPTVKSAVEVGQLLGQKTEAGKLHMFLVCWREVAGGRRIYAGVAQLLPAIWSDKFRNSPAAWFDGAVCRSCPPVEQILRDAQSCGLGLTPDFLRNMCWGPILLHTKDGECVWVEAAFGPDELARAFSPSPPTPEDELVARMVALLEAQPKTKISAPVLYAKAATQHPRLTVRAKDDRTGQADVPAPSGRAGRELIKRARQQARPPRAT
jgi:hypothetical protein